MAPPKPALIRGEAVVDRVLNATIEELACVGYRALRVEDVAARAHVNKTTIYRRWPDKVLLVRDAFQCVAKSKFVDPETGSLRADLLAIGRVVVEVSSSPQGQSLVRLLVAEGADSEVADIKKSLREQRLEVPMRVLASAVARGELAPNVNIQLVFQTFMGALHHRLFFMSEPVSEGHLENVVDLILSGANGVKQWTPMDTGPAVPAEAPRASSGRRTAKRQ